VETSNYYVESLWAVFATLVFTSRSRKLGTYLLRMAANHAEFAPVRVTKGIAKSRAQTTTLERPRLAPANY
jgi:hypothetical protein